MLTINFLFGLLTFIFLLTFLHYFFPFRYSLHQIFLYSFFIVPCAFRNRISLVQNAVFFVLLWTLCNAFYQGGFRGKFFHFSWCCFILLTARAIILLLFTQFLSFSTITPTIEVLLVMILCTQLLSLSFSLVFVHLKNQYRQILLTGCHSLFYIPYILLCFFYIFHMDYGVFYDRATCLVFYISFKWQLYLWLLVSFSGNKRFINESSCGCNNPIYSYNVAVDSYIKPILLILITFMIYYINVFVWKDFPVSNNTISCRNKSKN